MSKTSKSKLDEVALVDLVAQERARSVRDVVAYLRGTWEAYALPAGLPAADLRFLIDARATLGRSVKRKNAGRPAVGVSPMAP